LSKRALYLEWFLGWVAYSSNRSDTRELDYSH
jgi:hypothetical protein